MIELKLDAFLLTPIQRICQYPLQLNELLKYTSNEHKDYNNIEQAFNTMRDVASYINERKRRMEYVEIIHKWQNTVEGWQVRYRFQIISLSSGSRKPLRRWWLWSKKSVFEAHSR